MSSLRKIDQYRFWCDTEGAFKYVWSLTQPTTCPSDPLHTVDAGSLVVIDSINDGGADAEVDASIVETAASAAAILEFATSNEANTAALSATAANLLDVSTSNEANTAGILATTDAYVPVIATATDVTASNLNDLLLVTRSNHFTKDRAWDTKGRIKVAHPETRISSEFSYGFETDKWESQEVVNNIPGVFYRYGDEELDVSSMASTASSRQVTLVTNTAHKLTNGDSIVIVGANIELNGTFFVTAISPTRLVFLAKRLLEKTEELYEPGITLVYRGRTYTGARIPIENVTTDGLERSKLTVQTTFPHGFAQNTRIILAGTTAAQTVPFDASQIISEDTITVTADLTSSDPSGLTDFQAFKVVAANIKGVDDWYVYPSYVNVAADRIDIPPSQGQVPDQSYALMVSPSWESPIAPLENFGVYSVSTGDGYAVQFKDITPTLLSGLLLRTYAEIIDVLADFSTTTATESTVTQIEVVNDPVPTTREYAGQFVPTASATYTFQASVNRGRLAFWFDQASPTAASANIYINQTGNQTTSGTFQAALVAGQIYRFLLRSTTLDRGDLTFTVQQGEGAPTVNGTGLYFRGASTPVIGANPIAITSAGTSVTNVHAFFTCFSVTSVDPVNNTITVFGGAGKFAVDQRCIFVSKYGGGIPALKPSSGVFKTTQYSTYYVASSVTSGSNVTISLSLTLSGQPIFISSTQIDGLVWVLPIVPVPLANSLYFGEEAVASLQQGTAAFQLVSGNGIPELIDGTEYTLIKRGATHVQLLENGAVIDLTGTSGSSVLRVSQDLPRDDANTILLRESGLFPGASILEYDANGNDPIPGLIDGGSYNVSVVTPDGFKLADIAGNPIDITGAGSNTHQFVAQNGNADGTYRVSRVVDDNTFELTSSVKLEPTSTTFDGRARFVPHIDNVYIFNHGLLPGSSIRYDLVSGTEEGALVSGSNYFVGEVDHNYFTLHSTQSDAVSGSNAVSLDGAGDTSQHKITFNTVMSKSVYSSSGSLTQGGYVLTTSDRNIGTALNLGDSLTVIYGSDVTTLDVSSVSTSPTNTLTFDTAHGLATGDWVFYNDGTASNLVSGYSYYVENVNATMVKLFDEYASALAGTPVLSLTSSSPADYGSFVHVKVGQVLETTVEDILSETSITLAHPSPITTTTAVVLRKAFIMPSMESLLFHRGYDAGLTIQSFRQPGNTFSRQTRSYFDYQSGKSQHISFAVNFNPPVQIIKLARVGTVAEATTGVPHNLVAGLAVNVYGATEPEWNGQFVVTQVPSETTFYYTLASEPVSLLATGDLVFDVKSWAQSSVRAGVFDGQNGAFFEFDGAVLNVVRRSSVFQIAGTHTVTTRSCRVTGVDSNYSFTLSAGASVVIRGQTYKVVKISSDIEMYVQPPYRGVSSGRVVISRIDETRVPMSSFNVDRLDGTGPSGYVFKNNFIQLCSIDYSWYGAGKIKYMMQGVDGLNITCHEFIHNNSQTENYMRTGALPIRFEVANGDAPSYTPSLQHWGATLVTEGGYQIIPALPQRVDSNLHMFTGLDSLGATLDTTTTVAAAVPGSEASAYRVTLTSGQYTALRYLYPGTSVSGSGIDTGTVVAGFVSKTGTGGYLYISKNVTEQSASASLTFGGAGSGIPSIINLLTLRVSPSADNDRTGAIGEREVVNRTNVVVRSVDVTCSHDCTVVLLFNTSVRVSNFQRVGPVSLCEVTRHSVGEDVFGGLPLFTARVKGGLEIKGRREMTNTHIDLPHNVPMTNCILGGDGVYPDGPDTLTMRVYPSDVTDVTVSDPLRVYGSIRWSER